MRYHLEADLTKKVKDWLDLQLDVTWYKASDRFQNGVSDCIICCCGFFVAAELKADDGSATPQQLEFITNVKRAGGIGGICYTLREVKGLVQRARESNSKMLKTTS